MKKFSSFNKSVKVHKNLYKSYRPNGYIHCTYYTIKIKSLSNILHSITINLIYCTYNI